MILLLKNIFIIKMIVEGVTGLNLTFQICFWTAFIL